MSGRRAGPSRVLAAWFTCAVFLSAPPPAAAQRQVFVRGFAELTEALAGTYGDEGARIGPALDTMTAGLAEWDRAIREIEGRVKSGETGNEPAAASEMRLSLARMYLERGRLPDAVRELDAATHLDVRRADLHVMRGLAYEAVDRPREAGEAFRAAWDGGQRDPVTAYYVFRYRRPDDSERVQQALAVLTDASRSLITGTPARKATVFQRLGTFPDDAATPILPQSAYAAAFALVAGGEHLAAIGSFREAAVSDPLLKDPAVGSERLQAAIVALREGRLAEARTHLAATLAQVPASSEAHRLLGLAYWADHQDARSIDHFEAAIRANPRDERSRLALARVLSNGGRGDDAGRVLRAAIEALPDSALAHWWLAALYDGLNRVPEARREFEAAASTALGRQGALHAAIGRLSRIEGNFPLAAEAFEHQVRADPNDAVAHRQLARIHLEQDRADDAFAELVAAMLIDPHDGDAHAAIGQLHLDAGRHADAVTALRRALDLKPGLDDTRYALGTALMRLGRTEDARRELDAFERARQQTLERRRKQIAEQVRKEGAALEAAEGSGR